VSVNEKEWLVMHVQLAAFAAPLAAVPLVLGTRPASHTTCLCRQAGGRACVD
jgi:hypothetical protein